MDLETILQNFGYKRVFKKDGTLSVSGMKAYGKLLDILFNLSQIAVINELQVNQMIDELDRIIDEQL